MKKFFVLGVVTVGVLSSTLHADALKNSLTNLMNTKESSSVVDLGNINLNAKRKPKKPQLKHHSKKAVIATINGHKVLKKDADAYLAQRTQGKIKNFDAIPPQQQNRLIHEMAFPLLVLDQAKKELTDLEKETVFNRAWMQKEAQKIDIKDDDVLTVYNQLKQQALDHNNTNALPPYDAIKGKLKMQMMEKMMIGKLMKDVKIKVAP